MATQAEVIQFLESNFVCDTSGSLITFQFDIDRGRTQTVFAGFAGEWMIVSSPFASTNQLTAMQALEITGRSPFGLRTAGDFYTVTNSLPIADIDASEITSVLHHIAVFADVSEGNSVGGDQF